MAQYNQNLVFNGLGTFTILTAPSAGLYLIDVKITCPQLSKGDSAPSAVLSVINNGVTLAYTGVAGGEGFRTDLSCAAGDVLTLVLSSAAAVDQPLNVIKTNVAVSSGE